MAADAFSPPRSTHGHRSKFVAGLRVTDRETRDVAVMVFAGLLNKKLAAAISAEGQSAIGISAADARCFVAEPMVHNEVEGSSASSVISPESIRLSSNRFGAKGFCLLCRA